jgi:uncharacterized peroxidase-related enzyme
MSWITSHDDARAAAVLEHLRPHGASGRISRIWVTLAAHPRALEAWYTLHRALKDDPAPLTLVQYELLATAVSAVNGCTYCVAHHGPDLARALGDETLARAVARDYREADLPARDRVLLDFAIALTCEPSERTRADVERAREYGFDDAAILKATEIAAFFNATNRIVSALGIELEAGREPWEFGGRS